MPEKNYQDRSVVDKLGIKPGHLIAFAFEGRAIDPDLSQLIIERAGRPPALKDEELDIVLAIVDEATEAIELLKRWRARLTRNGAIWLLTYKRGQPGYIDQRELIIAGQQARVVDNKVCSISSTISAMRFVIRKKDRPA